MKYDTISSLKRGALDKIVKQYEKGKEIIESRRP